MLDLLGNFALGFTVAGLTAAGIVTPGGSRSRTAGKGSSTGR